MDNGHLAQGEFTFQISCTETDIDSQPTPLDALIGAHLYTILALKEDSALRRKAEELPQLGDYLDRILTTAGAGVKL